MYGFRVAVTTMIVLVMILLVGMTRKAKDKTQTTVVTCAVILYILCLIGMWF